ncbi:2-dehydropantoate 2-reductase [Bacillus sp. FSL K6-3431]|uniref:2-dehydropantoate 2-reductase n=1 Tax=Bacillus sp. FSL K6-3431 TaxID=2921500 RepID=UPI0030F69456
MKIGIIGGGAIGLLLAAYYGEQHYVTVYCKRREQAAKIESKGIQLVHSEIGRIIPVSGKNEDKTLPLQDLIIIAVKQHQLESILPDLFALPLHKPLLFIQNGMGHIPLLKTLAQRTIYVGTIEHGAVKVDDRIVSHNGIGKMNIAIFRGESNDILEFPILENKLFPITIKDDFLEMLEAKLIANAVINPLTTLFCVKNGELISNPAYHQVFLQLYDEVVKCFPRWNNQYIDVITNICVTTSKNTSSMLKDMTEGRKTEIDAILGYVIEIADSKGVDIPVVQFVYQAIVGMEFERGIRTLWS